MRKSGTARALERDPRCGNDAGEHCRRHGRSWVCYAGTPKACFCTECIENLNIESDGIYVDGTLGLGGRSMEMPADSRPDGSSPSIRTRPPSSGQGAPARHGRKRIVRPRKFPLARKDPRRSRHRPGERNALRSRRILAAGSASRTRPFPVADAPLDCAWIRAHR